MQFNELSNERVIPTASDDAIAALEGQGDAAETEASTTPSVTSFLTRMLQEHGQKTASWAGPA